MVMPTILPIYTNPTCLSHGYIHTYLHDYHTMFINVSVPAYDTGYREAS